MNNLRLYQYPALLLYWYDGDSPTIDIDLGFDNWMKNQKVRLYGVNTPELRGAEREEGLCVRNIVRSWCPPGTLVEFRSHKDKRGKYGRYLGEIFPPGWSESINARLYREGLAKIEAYSDSERAAIKALFEAGE